MGQHVYPNYVVKNYYSITEVATMAGVTRHTVWAAIKCGSIKNVDRVGDTYMVPARDVGLYIQAVRERGRNTRGSRPVPPKE